MPFARFAEDLVLRLRVRRRTGREPGPGLSGRAGAALGPGGARLAGRAGARPALPARASRRCTSPTTPRPRSAANWRSAGQPRRGCSTCSSSSGATPTACRRSAAPACPAALAYFGLDGITAEEKQEMRALVLRGGPWSADERAAILDYCAKDVAGLARLLAVMAPHIDLPRALLRGRYMAAAARMERTGVPIDTMTLGRLRQQLGRDQGPAYHHDRRRLRRIRRADVQVSAVRAVVVPQPGAVAAPVQRPARS